MLPIEPEREPAVRRLFYVALFATTLLPFLLVPFATTYKPDARSMVLAISMLGFLGGVGHVGLTGFYYSEPEFRQFFRTRAVRFFLMPAAVVAGTAMVYQVGTPVVKAYVLAGYFIWQTYHYQRQNHGVLSFVAAATRTGPPLWQEKTAFDLSCFAGILALFSLLQLDRNTALESHAMFLFDVGRTCMLLPIPVLLGWALYRNRRAGLAAWPRTLTTILGSLFFLPSFLFTSSIQAVSSYAWAHGLQYYVFMYFVGRGGQDRERDWRIFALVASCFVLGGALFMFSDTALWGGYADAVFGAYLGLVMVHFLVDAGVWRLREPFQGRYLRQAFGFLFSSPSEGPPQAGARV
ncbi:MAG: hypothetical protein AB7H96_06635 [Vicinamibacterales bacterium]